MEIIILALCNIFKCNKKFYTYLSSIQLQVKNIMA